jgi:hypothetical protein
MGARLPNVGGKLAVAHSSAGSSQRNPDQAEGTLRGAYNQPVSNHSSSSGPPPRAAGASTRAGWAFDPRATTRDGPGKETNLGLETPETERIDIPKPEPLGVPLLEPGRDPAPVEALS